EMPTIESIKRFVQMVMGVAIVPRMCVQWELEHGWMKEVKVRQLSMPRHVYLVSRRGARLPHAAAEIMRILREEKLLATSRTPAPRRRCSQEGSSGGRGFSSP